MQSGPMTLQGSKGTGGNRSHSGFMRLQHTGTMQPVSATSVGQSKDLATIQALQQELLVVKREKRFI